jgi:hypothetical protein
MSQTILVKKKYTPQDMAKNAEAPGKKRGLTSGSWIHDLCALRKVITLCPMCQHKFNPGRIGYIRDKDIPFYQASCDGCKILDQKCAAYFFEETFKEVRSTAADRRAETIAYRKQVAKLG